MNTYKPETAIKEGWLEPYNRYCGVLHRELMEVNLILFSLEQIDVFPFALFGNDGLLN